MNILTLGLDNNILDEHTPVRERLVEYGNMVDQFDLVVPGRTPRLQERLSSAVSLYTTGGRNKITRLIRLALLAQRLIRSGTYDVISTRDPYFLGVVAALLAWRYDIGLEIQIHGFEKYTGLRRWLASWVLRQADGVRVVSRRLAALLVHEFGVAPERITVNPIRAQCEFFAEKGKTFKASSKKDAFTFVTYGRLVPIKNIELQIRALARVTTRHPHARLLIVGDGPEKDALVRATRKYHCESQVVFKGWTTDVPAVFAESDCFVLSSNYEGYGLTPVEAACFGLPVIMTDVGCAGETILNGVHGKVIPVGDEEALVSAMEEMLQSEELRKQFTQANARMAQELPTTEETNRLYVKSWQNSIDRRKKPTRV